VEKGLSLPQKALSSTFFYDAEGSRLFQAITRLPEYYLTRCETEILLGSAEEIITCAGQNLQIIEFGSGSSEKTRLLLRAALAGGSREYVTIDISSEFLLASVRELVAELPDLAITALAGDYFESIAVLPPHDGPRLFLFLGSTIGNFERHSAIEFMHAVGAHMTVADSFLIGTDLRKDPAIIQPAYDDAEGLTARFNKNILARINHDLGGRFDLDSFEHSAPWVEEWSRIEMRLVSTVCQEVCVESLNRSFHFGAGESIHTENSHKWSLKDFDQMIAASGLRLRQRWTDSKGWFALHMCGLA
jgi:L-histidine N-alpha-methyltransferase